MSVKPNILFVGNYNRKDYVNMLAASKQYCNFFFLEFVSQKEITNRYFENYGKAIFWGDYKDVYALLNHIKPHKVLFIFIESYYHVLLNLACKSQGIKSYLLDHGLRDLNINVRLEKYFSTPEKPSKRIKSLVKILSQFKPRVKARLFLIKSSKLLPNDYAQFFYDFYSLRRNSSIIGISKAVKSNLRLADAYISYSIKNYEVHWHYDYLHPKQLVHFIGIPSFDHLSHITAKEQHKHSIILIDQGFASRGLLGWTHEDYNNFIQRLTTICNQLNFHLYIKLHPLQPKTDDALWKGNTNTSIIDENKLIELLPSTQLIISFFSTYLLPLMALSHTAVITLENHPAGRLDVSKSFIEAGVAHPVYNLDELQDALDKSAELHRQQLPNKQKFIQEWMYKFDGKAGERLRNILLSDEL